MGYWVSIHGRRFGPHSGGQIRTMLHSGQIPGSAEVWIPAEQRWIPAPDLSPVAPAQTLPARSDPGQPLAAVPAGVAAAAPAPGRPLNSRFNPLALSCFVLGIASLPLLALLIGLPIAVLAVVLGHRALHAIERSRATPVPQKGRAPAVAGLIVGYLTICVAAVVSIPALLALPALTS